MTYEIRHFTTRAGQEVLTFGLRDASRKLVPLPEWPPEERARVDRVARAMLGDIVEVHEQPYRRGGAGGIETRRGSRTALIYTRV